MVKFKADDAAGIFVAAASFDAYRILDPDLPAAEILRGAFKVLAGEMESEYGSAYGLEEYSDPLVFDLDGDGVELTALTSVAPYFDLDGDRFAEQAGWVRPDDALLALDANENGKIDDIGELFGAQGGFGFAELATHDGNEDGEIDSLDSVWSDLLLWRDLDQDGMTDAGEFTGLDAAGIASISLTSTPQTGVTNANNIVAATGSFTRTDESTGAVADIRFRMDDYETRFTGDTSVSTEAAALPEVKGHGTLTSLRVAMTLDPDLVDTVTDTLAEMTAIDLAGLREAATPILAGWARAVQMPDELGVLQTVDPADHGDVPILVVTDGTGAHVTDFAFEVSDSLGSYWRLGSGDPVLDGEEDPIDRPSFEDVLAQAPAEGEWDVFTGEQIGILERYSGRPIAIDQAPLSTGGSTADAVGEMIDTLWTAPERFRRAA